MRIPPLIVYILCPVYLYGIELVVLMKDRIYEVPVLSITDFYRVSSVPTRLG